MQLSLIATWFSGSAAQISKGNERKSEIIGRKSKTIGRI